MSLAGKTYWLIGASEGLGRALACELDKRGAKLVLSARSLGRLEALAGTLHPGTVALPMDVTNPESVASAHAGIGAIDGVIYAAGLYEPMRAQAWDTQTATAICEVNFIGAMRCLGPLVRHFAQQNHGHIVIIGSLSGYRGLPGAIGYSASKAAIMHLAENMRADLWHTGVKVQLINPGFVKSRLSAKNQFRMPFLMDAGTAAALTCDAMERNRFKQDFPWLFSLVFRLGRFLPQWVYQRLFAPRPPGDGNPRTSPDMPG